MARTYGSAGARAVVLGLCALTACQKTTKVEGFPESYAGIGIELTEEKGVVKVVRLLKGGPSEAAGIRPGDQLTSIDGRPTRGMSLGEVVMLLRGKPGSQLTLALLRNQERTLVVLRRQRLAKVGDDYAPR